MKRILETKNNEKGKVDWLGSVLRRIGNISAIRLTENIWLKSWCYSNLQTIEIIEKY